jgi:hypothetical protein
MNEKNRKEIVACKKSQRRGKVNTVEEKADVCLYVIQTTLFLCSNGFDCRKTLNPSHKPK